MNNYIDELLQTKLSKIKTNENVYKSSMKGIKNTLEDVISLLKEAKEED